MKSSTPRRLPAMYWAPEFEMVLERFEEQFPDLGLEIRAAEDCAAIRFSRHLETPEVASIPVDHPQGSVYLVVAAYPGASPSEANTVVAVTLTTRPIDEKAAYEECQRRLREGWEMAKAVLTNVALPLGIGFLVTLM